MQSHTPKNTHVFLKNIVSMPGTLGALNKPEVRTNGKMCGNLCRAGSRCLFLMILVTRQFTELKSLD